MSRPHEFSVPVRELDAAGKALRFVVRAAWLRGALEGTDIAPAGPDGDLDLRVSRSGHDIVVHGTLSAELLVPCARCLEPARIDVLEALSVVAVRDAARRDGAGGEQDAPADQLDLIAYDGETVVLDELIRDELVLAVPMIPLCSEACPGIRPQPSEQPAGGPSEPPGIDPRLRPLLRLKKTPTEP
jgi:uncharacterized protein